MAQRTTAKTWTTRPTQTWTCPHLSIYLAAFEYGRVCYWPDGTACLLARSNLGYLDILRKYRFTSAMEGLWPQLLHGIAAYCSWKVLHLWNLWHMILETHVHAAVWVQRHRLTRKHAKKTRQVDASSGDTTKPGSLENLESPNKTPLSSWYHIEQSKDHIRPQNKTKWAKASSVCQYEHNREKPWKAQRTYRQLFHGASTSFPHLPWDWHLKILVQF